MALRHLNRNDYKTLGLSALGATLELYDFVIFMFLLPELMGLFFPPDTPRWLLQLQSIAMFSAGFIVRPISGVIIAHFGDKLGRKRMFSLSIFLMAVPTLCIGLLPTYATLHLIAPLLLIFLRMMQGAAIGGEVPGSWVFVAEHIPKNRMGLGLGIVTCGISGGSLLGAFVIFCMNKYFTAEQVQAYAWRIPFVLGGIFGLIAVFLRRYLSETPVFKEIATKRKLSNDFPIKIVLKEHLPSCILAATMSWTTSAVVLCFIILPPQLLPKEYGIDKALVFQANIIGTMMMVIGNISLGWLHDRFGTLSCYIFGWIGVALSGFYFFTHLADINETQLILSYMLIGYFAGTTVTMPTVSIPAFPTAVRYTGVSFSYNMAFAASSIVSFALIQLLFEVTPLAPAYYLLILSAISIMAGLTHLAQYGLITPDSISQNKNRFSSLS